MLADAYQRARQGRHDFVTHLTQLCRGGRSGAQKSRNMSTLSNAEMSRAAERTEKPDDQGRQATRSGRPRLTQTQQHLRAAAGLPRAFSSVCLVANSSTSIGQQSQVAATNPSGATPSLPGTLLHNQASCISLYGKFVERQKSMLCQKGNGQGQQEKEGKKRRQVGSNARHHMCCPTNPAPALHASSTRT